VSSGPGAILARVGTTRAHLVALDPPDPLAPALEASSGIPVPLPALEVPKARRPGWATLAALAAGCGVAAILLGSWALVAIVRSDDSVPSDARVETALAVLTDGHADRIPLRGSVGRITLVVDPDARAVLALDGLGPAPDGSLYSAWLVPEGSATPVSVATFSGRERAVPLGRAVPHGARIGVTLERSPAPEHPSRPIRLSAVRG
jgi:Anti-sigma-K factor rskA, C-terminal